VRACGSWRLRSFWGGSTWPGPPRQAAPASASSWSWESACALPCGPWHFWKDYFKWIYLISLIQFSLMNLAKIKFLNYINQKSLWSVNYLLLSINKSPLLVIQCREIKRNKTLITIHLYEKLLTLTTQSHQKIRFLEIFFWILYMFAIVSNLQKTNLFFVKTHKNNLSDLQTTNPKKTRRKHFWLSIK
jgi:hypothetical protein